MSSTQFTKYSNFDTNYDSDEPLDVEEKQEQEYERNHNSYLNNKQKSKKQEKFNCKHKYEHEQIMYYGSSKCQIRALVDGGNIPMYRIYPYYNKNNVPIEKIYKLIDGKKLPDYNDRTYKNYLNDKIPKIGTVVFTGNLEHPLKKTLSIENHYEWKIININDDGTFNLERTDDNIDLMKFVLENELSETQHL